MLEVCTIPPQSPTHSYQKQDQDKQHKQGEQCLKQQGTEPKAKGRFSGCNQDPARPHPKRERHSLNHFPRKTKLVQQSFRAFLLLKIKPTRPLQHTIA
jgi:hypothetical protein